MKLSGLTLLVPVICIFVLSQTAFSKTAAAAPKIKKGAEAEYKAIKKENIVFLEPDKKTDLKKGDAFVIELEANPSTGYDWYFTVTPDNRKTALAVTDDRYFSLDKKPGSPSIKVIRFKTLFKGDTTIVFKYYRSWEGESKAAQTKKFVIHTK